MTAVVVIEGVVIVLLAILVAGLLRSHADILRELHRLGGSSSTERPITQPKSVGFGQVPIGEIAGEDLQGATRAISLKSGRSPTLLAFLSSGCATCRTFWEELQTDLALPLPETRIVVVTKGSRAESPAKLRELASPTRTLVLSDEAWDAFQVPMTPYFVLIDEHGGVLGEGSARNWDHLLSLFTQSVADSPLPTRLDTEERELFTDSRLRGSGIEPGDASLYDNPIDR